MYDGAITSEDKWRPNMWVYYHYIFALKISIKSLGLFFFFFVDDIVLADETSSGVNCWDTLEF